MKTPKEITREDLALMEAHQKKFGYNTDEIAELLNLCRTYVNANQPSCVTCQSNLRDAKTSLNEYYLRFKDETLEKFKKEDEEALKALEEVQEALKALEEVQEYIKPKKKKDVTK